MGDGLRLRHVDLYGVRLFARDRDAAYTQAVGWLARTATHLLIVLLASGQAVAVVCEAVCLAPRDAVHSAGSAPTDHHHQQAPAAHQHAAAQHTDSAHAEGQAVTGTPAAGDSHVASWVGQDCCPHLATPRVSLSASRLDTDTLRAPQAALVQATAIVSIAPSRLLAPTRGSRPGELSPARTPLVLRI